MVVDRRERCDLVLRKLGRRSPYVPTHALAAWRRRQRTAVAVDAGGVAGKDMLKDSPFQAARSAPHRKFALRDDLFSVG